MTGPTGRPRVGLTVGKVIGKAHERNRIKRRMGEVLRVLIDTIRTVATLLQPVMPGAMARMLDQVGVPPDARRFAALATPLTDGQALPPPQGVFPRYVEPTA